MASAITPTPNTTGKCACLNGGKCIVLPQETLCECPPDFIGERCDETYIAFIHNQNKQQESVVGSSFAVGVAIAAMTILVLLIAGFIVWKRCTNVREKRKWVRWQESRKQSKATIEGYSVVEPTPSTENNRSSVFGFHLLKNITCKKIFNFSREPTEKDVEAHDIKERKPEWVATITTDRQSSLPSSSCYHEQENQISIVLKKDKISFLSYTPGYVNEAYSKTNENIAAETESNTKVTNETTKDVKLQSDHYVRDVRGHKEMISSSANNIGDLPSYHTIQKHHDSEKIVDTSQNVERENCKRHRQRKCSFVIPMTDVIQT